MKNKISLKTSIWFLAAGLLLTACAASPEGKGVNQSASTAEGGTQVSTNSNKIDACALLPKTSVESVLGLTVQSAESVRTTEGTASTAAFSECRYQLDARQTITFSARRSPVADNTPEAIKRVRDTMKEVTGKEATEVAGLGDTAFWTAGTKQLHVFQGGNLYLYVTMMGFKDEAQAKEKAVELARRALAAL